MRSRRAYYLCSWMGPVALLAAGCAGLGGGEPCCYQGEVITAEVAQVPAALEDGPTVPFGELVPAYRPSTGLFHPYYPVKRLDIARVVYFDLQQVLRRYDANGDDAIEEPELTVLYMTEAARGLGHPVRELGDGQAIGAIWTSAEEVGGLVELAKRRRPEMTPEARKIFDELDLLRRDFRLDGTEPGEQNGGSTYAP